jgi:hypothetical protein
VNEEAMAHWGLFAKNKQAKLTMLVVAEIFRKAVVPSNIEHVGRALGYVDHKT